MKKFEYIGDKVHIGDLFDHLALRGRVGWELVTIYTVTMDGTVLSDRFLQLIFKREIT